MFWQTNTEPEIPPGMDYFKRSGKLNRQEISDNVPGQYRDNRWRLIQWQQLYGHGHSPGPFVFAAHDRYGGIVHQWPVNYEPSLTDLFSVLAWIPGKEGGT